MEARQAERKTSICSFRSTNPFQIELVLERNSEERRLPASDLVARIFGIVMVVLYIGFGTTIIFKAHQFQMMSPGYAKAIGAVMIVYGCMRAYKLYRKHFSSDSE